MSAGRRRITAVTGSRADFGLLRPALRAIAAHDRLELRVVVTGTHLLEPDRTAGEVEAEFDVRARLVMQTDADGGRLGDALALGRGVTAFAEHLAAEPTDVVLVLGDRIEPFAATAAASVAGIRVAHLHGGDRAEGIADESLRHAISKLAHVHLVATAASAERLLCMGEEAARVHLVGSPAIDDLAGIGPLDDDRYEALGRPEIVVLLHPSGLDADEEWANADRVLRVCAGAGRVLALDPNNDPGRDGIVQAIQQSGCVRAGHLPRREFVGLLRRVRVLVGNSSAGLIECAALPCRCINVGPRQRGREMPENVIDVPDWDFGALDMALESLPFEPPGPVKHPYGDGQAGLRTAAILADLNLDKHPLSKCCTY